MFLNFLGTMRIHYCQVRVCINTGDFLEGFTSSTGCQIAFILSKNFAVVS